MAPELAALFMRPVQSLAAPKRRASPAQQPSPKRARIEGSVVGDAMIPDRVDGGVAEPHPTRWEVTFLVAGRVLGPVSTLGTVSRAP